MDVIGLVFDGDDVLYDATIWRRWLLQLLGKIGLHTHYQPFFRVWDRDHMVQVNQGQVDYWVAMRTYLREVGLAPGQIDEVIAASHARYRRFQQNSRPLPGVLKTIAKLSGAGVPMAVLSNAPWSALRAQKMYARMGLEKQFSVVTSYDLGTTKPEPECYRAAVESLGIDRVGQVAFVGHDAAELEGAASIGMPTIAVNYDEEAQADVYLDRFERLTNAIHFRSPRLLAG